MSVERATYSLREVAALLGVSATLAGDQALRGGLPFPGFRIGARWIFRRSDVDGWLAGERRRETPKLRLMPRRQRSA